MGLTKFDRLSLGKVRREAEEAESAGPVKDRKSSSLLACSIEVRPGFLRER